MSMSKTIFRELLDKEASPALGCTEPMMFALAGAITRKHAPGKVLRVDMVGCGLMVTGVQAVGIPNTGGKTGAFLASAVGIVNERDDNKQGQYRAPDAFRQIFEHICAHPSLL